MQSTSKSIWLSKLLSVVSAIFVAASAYGQNEPMGAYKALLDAEQKLISRDLDTTRIQSPANNSQDVRYSPETAAVFALKTYWIPEADSHFFFADHVSAKVKKMMFKKINGARYVRLMVHPESENFYAQFLQVSGAIRDADIWASATSSSRTLMVWEDQKASAPFFAKLSLDASIGGVVRTIPISEMARSIGNSNMLNYERQQKHLPAGFTYFPETYSMIPKGFERGAMIIREIPDEVMQSSARIVPLFSLYATSPEFPESLLLKMIKKSGEDPYEFVENRILRPFIHQYMQMTVELGISMEPHAQNVLIGLDAHGMPNGTFVHRDFGGFGSDQAWRLEHGLGPVNLPYVRSIDRDYHQSDDKSFALSAPGGIATFFNAGFVYNLDRVINDWIKTGALKSRRRGWLKDFFEQPSHILETQVLKIIAEESRRYGKLNIKGINLKDKSRANELVAESINSARKYVPAHAAVSCEHVLLGPAYHHPMSYGKLSSSGIQFTNCGWPKSLQTSLSLRTKRVVIKSLFYVIQVLVDRCH